MAKDQLEGENVRQAMISVWHDEIFDPFDLRAAGFKCENYSAHISPRYDCLQAELKRKLSERNKLLSEYEVLSFIIYVSVYSFSHWDVNKAPCHPSFLSRLQQLGRKDRMLQQQQQKLDEAQLKAHEVSMGRVCSTACFTHVHYTLHVWGQNSYTIPIIIYIAYVPLWLRDDVIATSYVSSY